MIDIPGYEGLYAITSCGKVYSYKNNIFLKNKIKPNGYLCVDLYNNHNRKTFMVHRLVAQAFISNPNNYPEVNHINGNKSHNYLNNLEWCTSKYNCNYGNRNFVISVKNSKKCKCIETGLEYNSVREASRKLLLPESSINAVCRGDRKSTSGFHFIYI